MKIVGMIFFVLGLISLIVASGERMIPFIQGAGFNPTTNPFFLQPLSFLRLANTCLLVAIASFVFEKKHS